MAGLLESKIIFPFHHLDESLDFLNEPELPPMASSWTSQLTGDTPSQEEVDAARKFYSDSGFSSVSQYLQFYLRQDVLMLAKGVEELRKTYFDLLEIDILDVAKYTVSSIAALAAQRHLFKNRRVGMFAHDDHRVYSLLRQALRGGLTAVYRTIGGSMADYTDFIWLHRQQAEYEGRVEERTDEELELHLRRINGHILPAGEATGLDNFVNYQDLVGLYSNAGSYGSFLRSFSGRSSRLDTSLDF